MLINLLHFYNITCDGEPRKANVYFLYYHYVFKLLFHKKSQILCMVYVRFCFVQNFNLRNSIFKYDFITSKAHAWLNFKCYVCLRLAASTTMVRFI